MAVAAVIGLFAGWLLRPAMVRLTGTAPFVTRVQALAPGLRGRGPGLCRPGTRGRRSGCGTSGCPTTAPSTAPVLARACAPVGALAAGGYAGYAVTRLGDASELADQRLLRCAVAAIGGLLMMLASLALERACRVPGEDNGA
ncbi:DUF3180 family protein [Nocardioides sp. B-3]|uniref:DUF3180 family protein n=1 Tax=Nocardioides sp. B-3 TaxID=2895565 RepID=UPI0021526715|nr:DUF3180 family protein [Nocardioides sp. B-3]UUZ60806.1 DUF3180 family protein [Nocardioides sp. B-3]